MSFGKTESRRRAAARRHLADLHKCPRCGRVVRGNGYGNHKRACKVIDAAERARGEDAVTDDLTRWMIKLELPIDEAMTLISLVQIGLHAWTGRRLPRDTIDFLDGQPQDVFSNITDILGKVDFDHG